MRNSEKPRCPLDALLPRTRQGILAATFMAPDRWWYMSDLAKHLGRTPSSLQRDLAALTGAGILRRKREGNRVYFQADRDCPLFGELQGIMAKTTGLADVLRAALRPLVRRIVVAFVYGSVARSEEGPRSDVDLMVVGNVGLAHVAPLLRRAEQRLNRPVNATIYTPLEFVAKVRAGHHFLRAVLDREKLFVVGDGRVLEGLTGKPSG